MKSNFFCLVLIFLLISKCLSTKTLAQPKYENGYLVMSSNDTIACQIRGQESFQYTKNSKFHFKDEKGKKRKLKTAKVKSYQIKSNWYEAVWVLETSERLVTRYSTTEGDGERRFLKVVERRELIHYQQEFQDQDIEFVQSIDFIKRSGDNKMVRATQGLLGLKRKRLTEYFKDCQDLCNEIQNKELNTVIEILDFYSRNCQ